MTGYNRRRQLFLVLALGISFALTTVAQTLGPRPVLSPLNVVLGSASLGSTLGPGTFSVQNTSSALIPVNSVIIAGPNASEFTQTNNCGSTLQAGADCTISVSFSPSGLGARTATVGVIYGGSNFSVSAGVTGIGTASSLPLAATLLPAAVSAGTLPVLIRQAPEIFTFTNLTSSTVHIANVAMSGANTNDFNLWTDCTSTLDPSASCSIAVSATPSLAGAFAGTLQVTDDSATSPHRATLSGNAVFSGNYEIVNARTGKVPEVANTTAGTLPRQASLNGLQQQQWQLRPSGVNTYTIVNVLSSKVLDVTGASSANGALVQQYDSLGVGNQRWQLTPADDVHYKIINAGSGKALDMPNGSPADGTLVQQWDLNGAEQQLWVLVPTISYRISGLGGRLLEVNGGSAFNGTAISVQSSTGAKQQQWQLLPVGGRVLRHPESLNGKSAGQHASSSSNGNIVQQYDYLGGANQQWRLSLISGSFFKIINRQSLKALDLPAQASAAGVPVQQWDDLNAQNQSWSITPLLYFNLVSAGSGKALEPKDGSTANGALIQQTTLDGSQKQQWTTISTFSPGVQYVTFVNNLTGKVLDLTTSSATQGALVQQWDYLSGSNQQWRVVTLPDGSYEYVNRVSGKALDVVSASRADGALIQQWDYLGGANQKWQLTGTSQ